MSTKTAWLITAALRLTTLPAITTVPSRTSRGASTSVPSHVEYSFTRKGLTLGPILDDAMEAWGEANGQRRRRA